MLKSRLKFQLQVNSKFTSGDIFSQVAVSLFTLPSCSQINFFVSDNYTQCGAEGLYNRAHPGKYPRSSAWLPELLSLPASHLHSIQTPRAATVLWAFLQSGFCWPGTPFPPGLSALLGQGGDMGEPQLYSSLTQGGALCVFLGIKTLSSFKGKHKDNLSISSGGYWSCL